MNYKIKADYIYTICQPPIKDGVLIIDDNGRIIDIIDPLINDEIINDVKYYDGIICPSFINSHCHLELSYLRNLIPSGRGLSSFICSINKFSQGIEKEKIIDAARFADTEMKNNGIAVVGDISNTNNTFQIKKESSVLYHTFIESLGLNEELNVNYSDYYLLLLEELQNNNLLGSITPHSTYSLSKKLFEGMMKFINKTSNIKSIHYKESEEEIEFLSNIEGNFMNVLTLLGLDSNRITLAGNNHVEILKKYVNNKSNLQLVHNIYVDENEVKDLNSYYSNLYWCICPRSNVYIENKISDLIKSNENLKITIGTDSLASNDRLSILEEIKMISNYSPGISLNVLLKWATLNGAEYLKLDDEFGSFNIGKTPGVINIKNINNKEKKLTSNSYVEVIK